MKHFYFFLTLTIIIALASCKNKKEPALTNANNSVVTIYFKETDSTVNESFLRFYVDINNKGWVEFLTDFRQYFFSGVPQPLSRYQAQYNSPTLGNLNTHMNFRFSDVAFLYVQTQPNNFQYTVKCPANPGSVKDQYAVFYFKQSGKSNPFAASYSKGLYNMISFFEDRYLKQKVSGRNEYILKTGCEQVTHQILMDWNFVSRLTLHTNNKYPSY